MGICAKEMKKPFYVLTESFKFTRLYPLNQRDLPDEFKVFFEVKFNCCSLLFLQSKYTILLSNFSTRQASYGKIYQRCTHWSTTLPHHLLLFYSLILEY